MHFQQSNTFQCLHLIPMFLERPCIILKYIALIYLFESIVSGVHTENNNIKYNVADLVQFIYFTLLATSTF